jgi:hypothetical protein
MHGVVLGFEIAAGIALFLFVFFVVVPRVSLSVRAWWYRTFKKDVVAPPEIRRYLMKSGIADLKKAKHLAPGVREKVATQVLAAALDDDEGVFAGMHDSMVADAMQFLSGVPSEHCAGCGSPIFIHKAIKIDERYFCEGCGQARKKP